jgi:NADPH:quinone reductase
VLTPRRAPDPVAGPGQVVIRTAAVDVLFIDTAIRAGRAVDFFDIRPPYVPGNGVSGEVISTGDEVDPGWAGRSVVVHTGQLGGSGGYAGQAVAGAADLIPVPAGLGLPEAAALLHDGATAIRQLTAAAIRPGEPILVTAAAGGMGVLLVQLARAAGGRVIGAACAPSSARPSRSPGPPRTPRSRPAPPSPRRCWSPDGAAAAGSPRRIRLDLPVAGRCTVSA